VAIHKKHTFSVRIALVCAIILVFLMSLLNVKNMIFAYIFTIAVIALNSALGFASSRVRGLNLEVFGLGTAIIAVFYKGAFGIILLLFMLLPYFFFTGFNIYALPYFGGSVIGFFILQLFNPVLSMMTITLGILLVSVVSYLFFVLVHGDAIRPVKDTILSIALNIFIYNILSPILGLI
jgi:hypothetical protein